MIRKAKISDVKAIHRILQHFGDRGELLPRPLSALYENVRNFSVYQQPDTGAVAGCCSLQVCWEDLGEIRSLAVMPEYGGRGIGSRLINACIEEAVSFELRRVFTLTYRPTFFERFGFKVISRNDLPIKIWSDCITCVKFPDCDETAMMREVR
jgi:amino-acid N-acetyltransferase